MANSHTLGTDYSPRMWWADIEVPNSPVDVTSTAITSRIDYTFILFRIVTFYSNHRFNHYYWLVVTIFPLQKSRYRDNLYNMLGIKYCLTKAINKFMLSDLTRIRNLSLSRLSVVSIPSLVRRISRNHWFSSLVKFWELILSWFPSLAPSSRQPI